MDNGFVALPEPTQADNPTASVDDIKRQRRIVIIIGIVIIFITILLVGCLSFLLSPDTSSVTVARIRDVFIIVMAFESLFVGLVLVILMIQLARLTNLLQNEVQPILDSTNETISNLRGTTEFISANLAEPIIKMNEYVAGLQKITEIFGFKSKH